MIWLFWSSAAFLLYTLLLYPLLVWVIARVRNRAHVRQTIQPFVSLIVAVHNEERQIAGKIQNCLSLTYPKDKLEIIVVCDGCSDATPVIVRGFAGQGVRLIEVPERRGKHNGQAVARDAAKGDVLLFTDAGVSLPADAVQKIVANFGDLTVGCVSSEDRVGNPEKAEASYISLEMMLRRLESRMGSLVGVSGSFFAARRSVCYPWDPELSSDFFVPLHANAHGLRAVVDPESIGYYGVVSKDSAEFGRKVRTIVHGLDVFFTHLYMLDPFRYGLFAWQLVSHKLFRWLLPFGAASLLASNALLWDRGWFYQGGLIAQVAAYAAGTLAWAVPPMSRLKPMRLASFFVLGNAATLAAWWRYISGERFVTWEPSRRG